MKPYEWMVTYTPHKEWIEKRGLFSLIAFYSGPLGAGLYLLSLYFESLMGIFVSFLIITVIKGGAHLVELRNPSKFWRMAFRSQSSWISRGAILMVLFIGLVSIQLYLTLFQLHTVFLSMIKLLAAIAALGLSLYSGFVLNYMKAVSLWNSSLLPVLLSMSGLLGGFGLIMGIGIFDHHINLEEAASGLKVVIVMMAILVFVYFLTVTYAGPTGKESVKKILKGRIAPITWVAFVFMGMVFPACLIVLHHFGQSSYTVPVLVTFLLCEIIQGFSFVYILLKGGLYQPLTPA
jgi:formate-dependent nitrite reductase membrane component NrfD